MRSTRKGTERGRSSHKAQLQAPHGRIPISPFFFGRMAEETGARRKPFFAPIFFIAPKSARSSQPVLPNCFASARIRYGVPSESIESIGAPFADLQ